MSSEPTGLELRATDRVESRKEVTQRLVGRLTGVFTHISDKKHKHK